MPDEAPANDGLVFVSFLSVHEVAAASRGVGRIGLRRLLSAFSKELRNRRDKGV